MLNVVVHFLEVTSKEPLVENKNFKIIFIKHIEILVSLQISLLNYLKTI
jgi:hypothetical protein